MPLRVRLYSFLSHNKPYLLPSLAQVYSAVFAVCLSKDDFCIRISLPSMLHFMFYFFHACVHVSAHENAGKRELEFKTRTIYYIYMVYYTRMYSFTDGCRLQYSSIAVHDLS